VVKRLGCGLLSKEVIKGAIVRLSSALEGFGLSPGGEPRSWAKLRWNRKGADFRWP